MVKNLVEWSMRDLSTPLKPLYYRTNEKVVLGICINQLLFRRVNLHFYDFGVRGTPQIFWNFLGVPPKILKIGGFSWRREGGDATASAALRRGQNPFAAPGKTPTFFKILGGTPKKIFKILGVPLTPK